MSPELLAILGTGVALLTAWVALAGLIWQGLRRIDARIDRVESSLGARIDRVESSLGARIDRVESSLGARIDRLEAGMMEVRDRLSRLEGKMDLLEGYIMRRNEHGSAAE